MTSQVKAEILAFSERRTRVESSRRSFQLRERTVLARSLYLLVFNGEPSPGFKYATQGPSVVQQVR